MGIVIIAWYKKIPLSVGIVAASIVFSMIFCCVSPDTPDGRIGLMLANVISIITFFVAGVIGLLEWVYYIITKKEEEEEDD
jgi:hypothetical protein